MTRLSLLPAALGALLLVSACGDPESGVENSADGVTQFETILWGPSTPTRWFLLVVDDAPTEAARSLRQHLAADFRGFFDHLDDADCFTGADPAVYRPIDWRIVVVGSSGTLEPRFSAEDGLHAVAKDASPALLLALEEAVSEAILATETSEELPFVGQFELTHYLNLIQGVTEPRSPAETELSSVVSSEHWPWVGMARTRADTSPEGPAVEWTASVLDVMVVDWPEDGPCPVHERWEQIPALYPLTTIWTSDTCFEEATLFVPRGYSSCATSCMPDQPATLPSGEVRCRVYGEFPLDADCEQAPGWTFLEQAESLSSFADVPPVNLCELRQAEGAALDACVNDFACEGCEPSFCFRRAFTEDDESNPAHQRPTTTADFAYCPLHADTDIPWDRLRIVHGADQGNGLIRVVCQE
jgi:hypothetical protein